MEVDTEPVEGGEGGGGRNGSGFDRSGFLYRQQQDNATRSGTRGFSYLIGGAATRRIMGLPSMAVRETAALQLEERQTDWGYSRPVVALDLIWNLAFVVVSGAVLLSTTRERPSTPIRVWIVGYALQCLLHMGFVFFEYRRRRMRRMRRSQWAYMIVEEEEGSGENPQSRCLPVRVLKKLESNAVISLLWWILGFYWIVLGGQALLQDAPRLYWLMVVFLAFDVFFAIFCILLACIIGIALCCCLPCIIAILYTVAGQEGASDADLCNLPKFKFRKANRSQMYDVDKDQAVVVKIDELNGSDPIEDLALSPEDSECCICLSQYEDGAELHSLPCNHHFHSGCIVTWLRINATCPLCKFNILNDNEQV